MLGSSRVSDGFDGQAVERVHQSETGRRCIAYNFGVPGAGPVAQLLFGKCLLDTGLRPRLMVIEIMPTLLLRTRSSAPPESQWFQPERIRASEISLMEHYGLPADRMHDYQHSLRLNPWNTLRAPLLARTLPQLITMNERKWFIRIRDASGRVPTYPPDLPADRREQLRTSILSSNRELLQSGDIDPHCESALRDLLLLCRHHNIPTLLVLMPEGSSFRRLYTPQVEHRVQSLLTRLHTDLGVSCLDARRWVPDDHFADDVHLLAPGASLFSQRLTHDAMLSRLR
jgi:hypothetical protein